MNSLEPNRSPCGVNHLNRTVRIGTDIRFRGAHWDPFGVHCGNPSDPLGPSSSLEPLATPKHAHYRSLAISSSSRGGEGLQQPQPPRNYEGSGSSNSLKWRWLGTSPNFYKNKNTYIVWNWSWKTGRGTGTNRTETDRPTNRTKPEAS